MTTILFILSIVVLIVYIEYFPYTLTSAAMHGNIPKLKKLLAKKSFQSYKDLTLSKVIARAGPPEAVRTLLDYGANPNSAVLKPDCVWTPLMIAIGRKVEEDSQNYYRYGAGASEESWKHKYNKDKIINLLIQRGAKISSNFTYIMWISIKGAYSLWADGSRALKEEHYPFSKKGGPLLRLSLFSPGTHTIELTDISFLGPDRQYPFPRYTIEMLPGHIYYLRYQFIVDDKPFYGFVYMSSYYAVGEFKKDEVLDITGQLPIE